MPSTETNVDVSVVVPAFCEGANLTELVPRICEVFAEHGLSGEIVVVDDNSPDGTAEVCRDLAEKHPVRCRVRRSERGLSSAVIEGLRLATGRFLVVMDADHSHPPEMIPTMIAKLDVEGADFVIGSRYVDGGSTADDWGPFRWLNSQVATLLARPLVSVKDPMAGFFALRPDTFRACENELAPLGYKIGLELIVKGRCKSVVEVPIHFSNRRHGESKLTIAEQLKYLQHVARLYAFRFPGVTSVASFGVVGASGALVDLTMFGTMLLLELPFGVARAGAILLAMTWNYLLNREITFGGRVRGPAFAQYARFCAACGLGAALNWFVSGAVHDRLAFFGERELPAACVGIAVGFLFNYLLCRSFVFGRDEAGMQDADSPSTHAPPSVVRSGGDRGMGHDELAHAATKREEILR